MPWEPGVTAVLIANFVLLVIAIGGFAYFFYRTGSSVGSDPEAWYDEAISLAREVEQTAAAVDRPADRDEIQREIIPLSTRLKSHARSAPRDVDRQVVRHLHELGVDCYKVGMEHTERHAARTGVFIEDELDELETAARKLEENAITRLRER